ncbi:MAG: N-6 DNA methylase [Desulforudis sp.]|nr:MAG: N-6 DNA methylase [Desulforudis sp.]
MAAADKFRVADALVNLESIPEGKLVDFITGKLVNDTPEEYVRQNIARSLVLEYGYDPKQIEVEFPIKQGSKRVRVDLAVFPMDAKHDQDTAFIIVETKKNGTNPEDKREGIEQLKSYMAACLNCEYGMWTNGEFRACFRRAFDGKVFRNDEAIDIPAMGNKRVDAPTRDVLRAATGDNLLFAFRRCHNYIAGNQGLQKPEAFWELLKLIFCKIEDERSSNESLQFYVSESERTTMNGQSRVKNRLQRVFAELVVNKYPTIFKTNDEIEMNPRVLAYVVSELQHYSLLNSPVDVKGVAYEEVVGSNLRGDRGEFFTPRNACQMAVKMLDPQPNERVLDPAMGTGGFLVTAMNHVLRVIEEAEQEKWADISKPTRFELEELYHKRNDYLSKRVFGLDLNPNLVRAAKMNMVMNNDGSGNLFQCNSLENPHRWSADVRANLSLGSIDVLFTNPPFGSKIVIDDPLILEQYDVACQWVQTSDNWEIRLDRDGNRLFQPSMPPEILFVERCLQFLKPGTGRMAIVIPNGLLNNPGLAYFRYWLLQKAQIIAIVDMHRDLFQPGNDTQTSMVLLRRKAPGESSKDYPVFMAIADSIGHDKRGNTIYMRGPDGSLILRQQRVTQIRIVNGVRQGQELTVQTKIVDDELDDVANAYLEWLKTAASGQRQVSRIS